MEELLWEGFICDFYDLSKYLRKEIAWDSVHKIRIKFLVDTGASKSIIPKDIIDGIRTLDLGETTAQGICDKPPRFKVVLSGIAIVLDNDLATSIHEVLVPTETEVEKSIRKLLAPINASAILGRLSMDVLNLRIDPQTSKPTKIPTLLL